MNAATVRLFQLAVYGWLAFYMVALLLLGEAAWTNVPMDLFHARTSPVALAAQRSVMAAIGEHGAWWVAVLLFIALVQATYARWWLGLLAWALFRAITLHTWLASTGGIHLMENMLLWAALMAVPVRGGQVAVAAFWIARSQLLLAYVSATAHKFTGTGWLGGDALLRVANDPHFHLGWLAQWPGLCHLLSFVVPVWSGLFVFAVWWGPARRVWLLAGVAFHLSTALFMDLAPMGLAFIACYAIWSAEGEAGRILGVLRCMAERVRSRCPGRPARSG